MLLSDTKSLSRLLYENAIGFNGILNFLETTSAVEFILYMSIANTVSTTS
jgi:hypothetical protein